MWRRFLFGMVVLLAIVGPRLRAQALPPDRIPVFAAVFGTQILGSQGGDLDSRGALTMVMPGPDRVCFGLNVVGMAKVTSVEVREGAADVTGPVRIKITPLPSSDSTASGCLSGLSTSLVADIRSHPEHYYLNVATAEFPNGAARGQLFGTPTEGGVDWLPYLVGGIIAVLATAVGFLLGRRVPRRRTFEA
jgi:hypothetical protein